MLCEEDERALAHAEEAPNLAAEVRIPLFSGYGPLIAAPLLLGREPTAGTVSWLEDCYVKMRDSGVLLHAPLYLGHLARAHAQLGRLDAARDRLQQAFNTVACTTERWIEPELLRIRAQLELADGANVEAAESTLRTAVDCATRQGSRGFALRITRELGALLADQGRRAEGAALVAGALAKLEEGFGTPIVRRAKAWLEDVR